VFEPEPDLPVDESKLVPLNRPETPPPGTLYSGGTPVLPDPSPPKRSIRREIAIYTFIIVGLLDGAIETLFPRIAAQSNHPAVVIALRSRGLLLLAFSALSAANIRMVEKNRNLEYFVLYTIALYCLGVVANLLHQVLFSSTLHCNQYFWVRIIFHLFWVVGT